jgi:antitoxin YefM
VYISVIHKEVIEPMNILTFTEARASLKTVMDDVCKDHTPTIVSRVSGEHVVMLSLADFNSMQETMYLLSSPANAQHLMESIAQLKAGKSQPRELIRNDKSKKQKQATS